jgi:peptidoglycan/xylan/chitin deacetylase (PgdA/CDA1 family)
MKERLISLVKAILGYTEWKLKRPRYAGTDLLVLCYHAVPEGFHDRFQKQLALYSQLGFTLIEPAQLSAYYSGTLNEGPYLLVTFDDGLKNNRRAAEMVAQHNGKVMLFIVPAFTETRKEDQPRYYSEIIRPIVDENIEPHDEQYALTWDELKVLTEHGHAVGAHSYTHEMSASVKDSQTLEKEVVISSEVLRDKLHVEVTSFCSINQTSISVNAEADRLIRQHYRYHFTTYPGTNTPTSDRHCIYRRNVEAYWSMGEVFFAIGQWMPLLWKKRNPSIDS